MKKYLLAVVAMAGLMAVSVGNAGAQWNRSSNRITVKAEKRYVSRDLGRVDDFRVIRSRGIADVEYKQARESRITIYGADNVLQYLEVESSGGVLEVRMRKGVNVQGEHRLKVIATSPGLTSVSTTGTGDIDLLSAIEAKDFDMSTSGTGDISFKTITTGDLVIYGKGTGDIEGVKAECATISISVTGTSDVEIANIQSPKAEVSVSGTGDIEVGGKVRELVLRVRGTGDVDAYRLRAEYVDATVSGTGDISCYAEKSLRASASGAGSIIYGGDPREVDIRGNRRSIKRR